MKEIRNYEVVINEGNARCALIVNEEDNVLHLIKDYNLTYEIDFKNKIIEIYMNEDAAEEIILKFLNANDELLRFAMKSNGMPLAVGTLKTTPPKIIYETYVPMRDALELK